MFQTLDVPKNHKTIRELVKSDDPQLLDLLGKIFVFVPENRITIEKILKHPYLSEHHDEALEYKNNKRVQYDG